METLGRVCSHCKYFLGWDSFNLNKKGLNGRKSICRSCTQDAAKLLLQYRREKDPESIKLRNRKKGLKSNYDLDLSSYNLMSDSQHGKCAICKKKPKKHLFVDHCHTTGEIRGLLCQHCNTLLGMAFDDITVLGSAINYLNKHCGREGVS